MFVLLLSLTTRVPDRILFADALTALHPSMIAESCSALVLRLSFLIFIVFVLFKTAYILARTYYKCNTFYDFADKMRTDEIAQRQVINTQLIHNFLCK